MPIASLTTLPQRRILRDSLVAYRGEAEFAAKFATDWISIMAERVFNFSPGPAVLPLPVLEQAQRDLVALPGVGMSVLEISHRSKTFDAILAEAVQGLRDLLSVPAGYHIMFLQGGAS